MNESKKSVHLNTIPLTKEEREDIFQSGTYKVMVEDENGNVILDKWQTKKDIKKMRRVV